ncbi:MAG TPA: LytTR family transcriptional regulator DNA-binding domain-containing protein [Ureibacillus sp.]|nr:LytTR family transcriptional regulator DNA-binding domain-containing protein [Ureibacillus sp.]
MSDLGYVKQLNTNRTGMVYKFIKNGDIFIHTMIIGDLLHQIGFTPTDIVGKTLHDFYPKTYANIKHQYYLQAWEGNYVQYETEINGILQVASLRPVFNDKEVIEVVGSCINITEKIALHNSVYRSNNLESNITGTKNLMLKESNYVIFVPLKEIMFIERLGRKTIIHTIYKDYVTNDSLSKLYEQLDVHFIFCHRSFIINMDFLEKIEQRGQCFIGHFKNNKTARISKNMVNEIKNYKTN